jgi:hypothetical protein
MECKEFFSKILASGLQSRIAKLVHLAQTGFVKIRQITKGFLYEPKNVVSIDSKQILSITNFSATRFLDVIIKQGYRYKNHENAISHHVHTVEREVLKDIHQQGENVNAIAGRSLLPMENPVVILSRLLMSLLLKFLFIFFVFFYCYSVFYSF